MDLASAKVIGAGLAAIGVALPRSAWATCSVRSLKARASEKRSKAADLEIAARTAHAEAALADRRAAALGEIEGVAIDAAQEIVARVTGKTVEHKAAAAAVADVIARG